MTLFRPAAATLAVLVAASSIAQSPAAAPAKQLPPRPAPSRPFQLQPRTHYVLPNGVQVNLLKYGTVPKVSIDVDVEAGSAYVDAQHTGLASLVAELMTQGTESRSGEDIARAAADMGGSLNAGGGTYQSSFSLDVLSESATTAVTLLGDVVLHPSFPAKDLERLRTNRLRTIAVSLANPGFLARQKYAQLMYGDQPYGRLLPTEAIVKGYTSDDVRKHYDANFGAQRTVIYVVGQFDEIAVRAAINAAFGSWRKGAPISRPLQKVESGHRVAFIPQPGASQSNVIYGIEVANASSADAVPLEVMDSLLGGSFASRITSNIRENKGYTYSPGSYVALNYKLGTWQETAAVTTASTGPAIQEIINEINRLRATPPPEDELAAIKRNADGLFILKNSTRFGLAQQLEFVDFHGLSDDYLVNYTRNIDAVTPAQVQAMAVQYLKPEAMTLVVVGDPTIVKSQLAPFEKVSN